MVHPLIAREGASDATTKPSLDISTLHSLCNHNRSRGEKSTELHGPIKHGLGELRPPLTMRYSGPLFQSALLFPLSCVYVIKVTLRGHSLKMPVTSLRGTCSYATEQLLLCYRRIKGEGEKKETWAADEKLTRVKLKEVHVFLQPLFASVRPAPDGFF